MNWLWRGLRLIWLTTLGLLTVALCLAAWFLSTTEGARQLATIASTQLPALKLNLKDGTVLTGLSADSVRWGDEQLQIDADNLRFRWRAVCLLQRRVCLDTLEADSITVTRRVDDEPAPPPRTEALNLPAIDLPVAITVGALQLDELILDLNASRPPVTVRDITLSASASGDTVEIANLSADYLNYRLATEGKIRLAEDYPLDLRVGAVIPVPGLSESTPVTVDGRLDGDLAALSLNAASGGPYHSTLIAQANILDPTLPLRAALRWESVQWPPAGTPTVVANDGVLTIDGNLDDLDTTLKTTVTGARIPTTQIDLSGLLNSQRFAANAMDLGLLDGHIRGTATADWSDGLSWNGRLWFEDINPQALLADYPGALHGSVITQGELADGGYRLSLEPFVVQGELRGYPVHLSARVNHDLPDRWQVSDLQLISEDNRLTLNATLADELTANGRIDADALQQLLPGAGGSLRGTFGAAGKPGTPDVTLALASDVLRYNDIDIRGLSLKADVQAAGRRNSTIDLRADRLDRETTRLDAPALRFNGRLGEHTLTASVAGPRDTSAEITLDGGLDDERNWLGQLRSAQIALPAHRLTLLAPTALSFDQRAATLSLAAHCWQSDEARLCLDEPLEAGRSGSVVASLSNYNLARLNPLMPEYTTLSGPTDAQIRYVWGETNPNDAGIALQAGIQDGRISRLDPATGETLNFDFTALDLTSTTEGGLIRNRLKLTSTDLGNADATLVLNPGAADGMQIDGGNIDFSGFDLAFLKAFFPRFETLSGTLSVQGDLAGKLSAPTFDGRVILDAPRLAAPDLPLSIDGGRIQARVNGDRAVIAGKLDSGNGQLNVRGQADWRDPAKWRSEIQLQGQSLVIHQKPVVESVMAPDIRLTLTPGRLQVGGEVRVITAVINIREIPEGATTPSADVVIIDRQSEEPTEPGALQVTTDVRVVLGEAVRLSGYGLEAQLSGDFRVVQEANRPLQLYGEITVPEGIYKSYGQDLTVEDGQILLVGPIAQTTLDIEAFREVDNIKAGLQITGDIENPVITLYSEPPMEQERILAYIVLGRDIEAGENNDSNILATAALSMGIANGRGLATDIAETFGIREFNIEASGRGEDTQVLLSGRLSSRLLVRYGVGVFTPVNTLYLRYDLTKRLYLETAQGLERAVDLFYSFEF